MDPEKNITNISVLYPEFWQKAPLFNHALHVQSTAGHARWGKIDKPNRSLEYINVPRKEMI